MIREKNNSDNLIKWLILASEVVILNILLIAQLYIIEKHENLGIHNIDKYFALMSIAYLVSGLSSNFNIHQRFVKGEEMLKSSLMSLGLFTVVSVAILYIVKWPLLDWHYSLPTYALIWIVMFIFRYVMRQYIKWYRRNGRNFRRVIFVGDVKCAQNLYKSMKTNSEYGYKVLGYFADRKEESIDGSAYLGKSEDVLEYLDKDSEHIDMLYCLLPQTETELTTKIIKECDQRIIRFMHIPVDFYYANCVMSFELQEDTPVFCLHNEPLTLPGNRIIKRIFDIVFSGLFLIFIFPWVYIIFGSLIKLSSPGPVFFKQKRNGLGGEPFWCYKFRSMKINVDSDKVQATKNDPRKTKIGEIMRKTSVDELPQFINVLRGEMSVCGPRPHMLKHTEEYSRLIGNYMVRHFAKPGITGYAQVTGFRGETQELWQMEGRVKRDIWYIENWSVMLDLYIIVKTISNALLGEKEAY